MRVVQQKGYAIRRVDQAPVVECSCGPSTRVLTAADGLPCSLHVTHIKDAVRHYHRVTTEVYYILEGEGLMELNEERVAVGPGMVIYIEPGTWHRVTGDLRTIVFGVPALRSDDEYYE